MTASIAFLHSGPAAGHRMVVGGLSVLERRVRELARAGVERVVVAGDPVDFGRVLPIPVDFVATGSPPPDGARVERGDVIADIEVTDAASRRRAEWAIIRRTNKSFEGPVDALINWRFSMRITRLLSKTPLTPNHVTLAAIAVGITAGVLLLRADYVWTALAGVLLQVNSILDSCDGELARLRFQYSRLGQWLDNLSDDIVDNLFIVAVGVTLGGAWLVLAIIAASGRVACSIIIYTSVYRRTGTGDVFAFRYWFEGEKDTDAVYDPRSPLTWIRSMGRRDTFVFVWMVMCLIGYPNWVVGHGLGIAAINMTMLSAHLWMAATRRPIAAPAAAIAAPPDGRPRISVLIRSFNRLPALCELIEILLDQDHDSFEVIVIEQSTERPDDAVAHLAALEADPRLRVERRPPLGGARARNHAVLASRADLLVFVDDDDLPVGRDFLRSVEQVFVEEPRCAGLTCRQVSREEDRPSIVYRALARFRTMRFSPLLRMPFTYPRYHRRLDRVHYVHGTGGAFRRHVIERFGGWDEDTPIEDEASLGFRVRRGLGRDEYLCFDPRPRLRRRLALAGGLAKRGMTAPEFYRRLMTFVHHIVARYHPVRVRVLYPLYVAAGVQWTISWIFADSQRHQAVWRKFAGGIWFLVTSPFHALRMIGVGLGRRPGSGEALVAQLRDRPPALPAAGAAEQLRT